MTPREGQILHLIAEGHTLPAIALHFGLSLSTVKTHAEHIRQRLGATNAANAVAIGFRRGLLG
jgi:DNA-binding CsgD family transcriptional regulator